MKNIITQCVTILFLFMLVACGSQRTDEGGSSVIKFEYTPLTGIGQEDGVMRRDPSDVIKVGNLYYVWYSKGKISPGYDATVWYATSRNGIDWTEQGMALTKGKHGTWEGASVFTPNILVAEGRYWLFYTGVSREYERPYNPDSQIGIAVSDSPDGPWERLATNPVLVNSYDPNEFDSHLVDDACLIVRDGKYWCYYKGRQLGKSPAETQMGVAIADQPQGPYRKHEANPVIPGNHEVVVWPQGKGVAALIGTTGPEEITNTVQYAEDGIHFSKINDVESGPWAGGTYRPEAFTESGKGDLPKWGIEIGRPRGMEGQNWEKGQLPFLQRFDLIVEQVMKWGVSILLCVRLIASLWAETAKPNIVIIAMLTSLALKAVESAPPNVVLIFADDLGYGDVGCYGATKVRTPHIDRLAAEGKRFTDAHSASAVCTPSRYGLLTGEYPVRANGGKGAWGPLSPVSGLIIEPDKLTVADVFKKKGYATAVLGKWHLGFGVGETDWQKPARPGPLDLGFDYFYGLPLVNSGPPFVYVENDRIVGGDPNDPLIHLGPGTHPEATPVTPIRPEAGRRTPNRFKGGVEAHKRYNDYLMGTVLAEKAVDWIAERKDDPFFLYLSTTNIHHPFTPHEQFQGTSEAGLYGDFIHELDWIVGEVLQSLEDNGLSDNTLVIFTSDNGGMFNIGGQAAFEAGHRQNGDLLGFKFGVWEGGHRVPFIARWHGKIEAGTVSDELICNVDMLATVAALTGQTLEDAQLRDGVNILPALLGDPTSPLRDQLVLAPRQPTHLSLRKGKWMYIGAQGSGGFNGGPGDHGAGGPVSVSYVGSVNSDIVNGKIREDAPPAQLYDLEKDLSQTTNLYHQFPEVVQEMEAILKTYRPKS